MIRRAIKEDMDRILDLLGQVLMVHHKGRPDLFKANVVKYKREQLEEMIMDDNNPIFVNLDNQGVVLGYAFCQLKEVKGDNVLVDRKTLYIDDLCVDEKQRGKHVGKALYEYVLEYAKEIGCYNVTLNVWECNPGARAFYDSCGLGIKKTEMEHIL